MAKLETDPIFHDLRGLFCWMQSYFDGIFYLSVFPPHYSMRRRRLLMRWIAEGYSRDTSGTSAEENAERLFSELVNLSIVQQQNNVLFQVNGFFHEYIISRPMEDNLVFALDGNCSLNSRNVGQHLTIRSSWNRDITVYRNMDLSRLRSLTVFGKWMPFFLSTNMSLLRVLDLADTSGIMNGDLEHIGMLLPRLKFLSLRGCKGITHLPRSLCHMRQLQTLDVRHTFIAILPLCIIKLQKLQYIRAGRTVSWDEGDESVASLPGADVDQPSTTQRGSDNMATALEAIVGEVQTSTQPWRHKLGNLASSSSLSKLQGRRVDNCSILVPAGVRKLTAMRTLGVVNVSVAGGKAILKELKELTQLRKLGVSGITRENVHEFFAAMSSYSHLESLSMRFEKDKQGSFLCLGDNFRPSDTLKSLKIYGDVRILPGFIDNIWVNKWDLEMTILRQQDMNVLAELPTRGPTLLSGYVWRRLSLRPVYDGELHVDTSESFGDSSFRVLEIHCSSRLQVTFLEDMTIPAEVLKVHCSSESSLQVSGLHNISMLKQVWLKGFYGDTLKREIQNQLAKHPYKPVLKCRSS
jgi:hypothetical protein